MVATVSATFRTLSVRPRYYRRKAFVEGDEYREEARIVNEGEEPFPPEDMVVDFILGYPTGQEQIMRFQLEKGELQPGNSVWDTVQKEVMATGTALLRVEYSPYGQGSVLYDEEGAEIEPAGGKAIATFHAVTIEELYTLTGLYLAAFGTILAAVGLLLNVFLR